MAALQFAKSAVAALLGLSIAMAAWDAFWLVWPQDGLLAVGIPIAFTCLFMDLCEQLWPSLAGTTSEPSER